VPDWEYQTVKGIGEGWSGFRRAGLDKATTVTRYMLLRVGAMWPWSWKPRCRAALGDCDDMRRRYGKSIFGDEAEIGARW
jgi:hypothetical protein